MGKILKKWHKPNSFYIVLKSKKVYFSENAEMKVNADKYKTFSNSLAKYFLYNCNVVGELISPLKMQKIVYLAYVDFLVRFNEKLFIDRIEAWPMGPVVVNLYTELKPYGSLPISEDFLKDFNIEEYLTSFKEEERNALESIVNDLASKSAFELVNITHNDKAWLNARKGLSPTDPSNIQITDEDIIKFCKSE